MFAFAGPAYLVSVGYMDPGNWATDLEGGARFGYRLLWVLVMSNPMAILLQTLSARLGIVTGRDLAQACRETYPRRVILRAVGALRNRHRRLRPGGGAGRRHRAEPAVSHSAADRRLGSPRPTRCCCCGSHSLGIRVIESLHPGADRRDRGLLSASRSSGPAAGFSETGARPGAAPERQHPVPRHRDPGRHRDAAQSVPAFGAGADAQHRHRAAPTNAPPATST